MKLSKNCEDFEHVALSTQVFLSLFAVDPADKANSGRGVVLLYLNPFRAAVACWPAS